MTEEIIYIGVSKNREEPEIFNPFTRTEVIKLMTEAMSYTYFNDVHASEPDMLEKMAEVALNVLLKGYRNDNKDENL